LTQTSSDNQDPRLIRMNLFVKSNPD